MTEFATESFFSIPSTNLSLFYRVWGNPSGIPLLFVHGGPGNDVDHYRRINSKLFDSSKFQVIEVDQRGTGKSTPSVREDFANMKEYLNISIDKMSDDFEILRRHLNIDKWLVFGGSWGSTLGLHYAEHNPTRCLGLILRGIYLNTKSEFDAIYCKASFEGNERCIEEFNIFFELVQEEAISRGEELVDVNDSERIIRLYESMILNGNRDAMWRFYVFESNLADDDPADRLDPYVINEGLFPEAISVSFFEARLFLRGTFEEPIDLLANIGTLRSMPIWVVQGTGDGVCPDVYARQLVESFDKAGIRHTSRFVDAGHRSSSNGITEALLKSLVEFYDSVIKHDDNAL